MGNKQLGGCLLSILPNLARYQTKSLPKFHRFSHPESHQISITLVTALNAVQFPYFRSPASRIRLDSKLTIFHCPCAFRTYTRVYR